ncbi:MAG: NAD-dependent succinate-semialdehyde dehydrogenase [Burkholderiaceae bacterium]|nr:NAD-dependent succinate-semialdehyde dehydrogenase [Burkholderiaceae bacterium]
MNAPAELPLRLGARLDGENYLPGATFAVVNPHTGAIYAEVADCSANDARRAVDASHRAFQSWRQVSPFERARLLQAWHDEILRQQERLALAMVNEMGKPLAQARGEVAYAAAYISLYAEEAKRIHGETFSTTATHKRLSATRIPVGPVYAITPWNFPAAMITRKLAPALAAGCTAIVKPAEQSPVTAIILAEIWEQVGGPAGTLQVIPARDPVPVSKVVFDDARVRKLTFTGSTEVGRRLYQEAARTIKKVSLELGGHAPFLIFEDADIDQAVEEVVACKFRNSGQTCVCTNRIYVQRAIVEAFSAKLAERTAKLKVGDPLDAATEIGPLVDGQGLAKVSEHVADAVAKGARVLTGGQAGPGFYYAPTVLADVTPDMRIMTEETFGPVAPITVFDTEEEAVRAANDTPFGLAAYLYTHDLSRAYRVSEALEYGIVGINDGAPASAQAPFGGVKDSGLGREGGHWGLEEYLDIKYTSIALKR